MGRHNRPGDPAQDAVETVELPAVPEDPTPPGRGRHRGSGRAARAWWPKSVSQDGDHEAGRRARGHRRSPVMLHATAGAVTVVALSVSAGLVAQGRVETVRPEPVPVEGRFASVPSPGTGSAPVTSGPVLRETGLGTIPRPVTRGTPSASPSQRQHGDAPDRPRQAGAPSASPSPGGGSPSPTLSPSPAPADPTEESDRPCPWRNR
jgi:hypothetical protein